MKIHFLRITVVIILVMFFTIWASAAEIDVPEGPDAISTALAGAVSGDILLLSTDGGVYTESAIVVVDKAVSIKSASGLTAMPVWTTAGTNHIALQSDLVLEGIVFEGFSVPDSASSAIINGSTIPNDLTITGCEFRNFKDAIIITEDATGMISSFDSVLVTSGLFHNSGAGLLLNGDHPQGAGQHTDNVPGAYYLSVEKSTFYNLADEGIKLEAYVPPGDPAVAIVNYITLDNCGAEGVYIKEVGPASKVTNSVITNCDAGVKVKYLASFEVTHCDVWGNGSDYDGGTFAGAGCFSHDPWYEDTANGVFNYAWSQLFRASSEKGSLGDPRWGSYDGPPRLALNAIGPGTITVNPLKEVYDLGDVVTVTITPDANAELIAMLGDTLDASGQVVMDGHKYIAAQFAPAGAEVVDINGSFDGNVDWSIAALELNGTNVTFKEVQNGGILLGAGAPDTLTVTTDSTLSLVENDLYLAILSTKGHSHGHPHNTQVVDNIEGLGLTWERVTTQRGTRNQTVLNVYKAQGTPSGDGKVSATLHNFPAGFCIALSVARFSGVDAVNPIANVISHNTIGFNEPLVEITGYPRPASAYDQANYSVKVPVTDSSAPVCAIIAHRNRIHTPGEGFAERDEFWVESGGNTNSISLVNWNIKGRIEVAAGSDGISNAMARASSGDEIVLITDGGIYTESAAVVADKTVSIEAATGLEAMPNWVTAGTNHITLQGDLILGGILFDGQSSADAAIINSAAELNELTISGCEFKNFNSAIIKKEDGAVSPFKSVVVSDCILHDSDEGIILDGDHPQGEGQHDDNVPGTYFLSLENNTIYNMAGAGVKLEAYVPPGAPVTALINRLTVNNCGGEAIYIKEVGPASKVTNCVVTNNAIGVKIKYLPDFKVTNSNVWNNTKDFDGGAYGDGTCWCHDPWYKDAANGDFNYAWSQFFRAGDDKGQIGDSRWGANNDAPPRLIVNTIGPGTITVDPVKEVYDSGDIVTVTVTPDAGAELVQMIGDTLNAGGQVVMDAHRFITAQFAPVGAEVVDINGTFAGTVDWSVIAMEMRGTNVACEEIQYGGILLGAGAPDTMTVTIDSAMTLVENDFYLAIISTKGHSHGHQHNSQVVDEVSGLGLDWEFVAAQRGSRNATVLHVYKANGTPSGDGLVSATLHNFPAGFCIALTVVRYSGIDVNDPFGTIVSRNTLGLNGPAVELSGYPRPDGRTIPNPNPDADSYSVKLPLETSGNPVCAIIAHRNREHTAGEGFNERNEFWVEAGGNTNSITIVDTGIPTAIASKNKMRLPVTFAISNNYPNPFNPETVIKYQLPRACDIKLYVYNVMGQKVATLYDGSQVAGYHSITWNGLDNEGIAVSSGLYFYRLEAESFTKILKMMLVR